MTRVEMVAREPVLDRNGGGPSRQGGDGQRLGPIREIQTQGHRSGRERRQAVPGTPGVEIPPITLIGAPRRPGARSPRQIGRFIGQGRKSRRQASGFGQRHRHGFNHVLHLPGPRLASDTFPLSEARIMRKSETI